MPGPADLPPAGVPPQEAINFFRSKGYRIGFSWLDVFKSEHVRAFTVAKAMTRDLLEDIRAAVDAAIADGTTLADFKRELRPKLQARGWWGKKTMIDPLTAQAKTVQLGSDRRLKTIFDTNLRTAYAAGKWERIQRTKAAFPYIEYGSMRDGKERPQHHAWHGTILPVDDPWWDTHYPPCDWACRCWPIQRSKFMLERQGKTVTAEPKRFPDRSWTNPRTGETGMIEQGIGRGWDYNVGKEYLRGLQPSPIPESFDGPDEVGASASFTSAQAGLVDRFLAKFGIDPGGEKIWMDRDGWPLAIGRGWFIGQDRAIRLPGGAGGVAIDRIAAAIAEPDSIAWVWIKGADGRALLMRRYMRSSAALITTVEIGGAGWRWSIRRVELEETAAGFNPYQAREPKGSRHGGQFRSTGTPALLAAIATPNGVAPMARLGDASPSAMKLIEPLGVGLRSPAIWLEHGRARHILKTHGGDSKPVRPRDLVRVHRMLNSAGEISLASGASGGKPARIRVVTRTTRTETHAIFEVRRRGLTLQTMYKRAPGENSRTGRRQRQRKKKGKSPS